MEDPFDRREVLIAAAAGAIALRPSLASASAPDAAQARSFDFLHGRWNVRHRQLLHRLASSNEWFEFPGTLEVAPILDGLGNFDRNELAHPKGAYEAHSLRLYNPASRKWSIWWLDSRSPNLEDPVEGGFSSGKGTFFSNDMFDAKPIRVRTTYEPLSPRAAQWTQAFSTDGEASWEINWIMDFRRSA